MTKAAALQSFFSRFLTAYPVTSVPDCAAFPYLTYEPTIGAWGDQTGITVNLWYYTTSETDPNAKAAQMSESIGMGGILLPCDGGAIWIKRGSPWCQNIRDDADPMIKRRYINVTAEYLTSN